MDAKKNIEESLDLLRKLAAQRDDIEHQMGQLHLAVRGFCNLISNKAEREGYKAVLDRYRVHTSITDLIRLCLSTADIALTPKEIRGFIIDYGSEASTQQNLLQSIHTILRRMQENNEVKLETNADGDKVFRLPTFGEQILGNLGVGMEAVDAATKVGKRMENRFAQATAEVIEEWRRKNWDGTR